MMLFMLIRIKILNVTFIIKDHNVERHQSYRSARFPLPTDKAHKNPYVFLTHFVRVHTIKPPLKCLILYIKSRAGDLGTNLY